MTPRAARPAFTLFRGRAVEVDVHFSVVVLACLAFIFIGGGAMQPPGRPMTLGPVAQWVAGAAAALLLVASLAIHEAAHFVVERLRGRAPRRLSLAFLHSTHPALPEEDSSPWGDFAVAVAGMAASLVVGLVALAAQSVAPAGGAVRDVLGIVSSGNLTFVALQCLPVHPLDGSRALRAVAWGLSGDPGTGTRWAAQVSLVLSGAIAFGCVAGFIASPGSALMWIMGLLMAVVLGLQSVAIARLATTRRRLTGWAVGHVMEPLPEAIPRILSVADALAEAARRQCNAFIVEFQGRLGGVVTLSALHGVPEEERLQTPVGQVTRRLQRRHLLEPQMALESALRRMAEDGLPLLPVLSSGSLVGVVSQESVARRISEGGR